MSETVNNELYLSAKEAAEMSGYTPDYLSKLAREGKLQAKRIGRAWYVSADSVKEFFDASQALEDERLKILAETRAREYRAANGRASVEVPYAGTHAPYAFTLGRIFVAVLGLVVFVFSWTVGYEIVRGEFMSNVAGVFRTVDRAHESALHPAIHESVLMRTWSMEQFSISVADILLAFRIRAHALTSYAQHAVYPARIIDSVEPEPVRHPPLFRDDVLTLDSMRAMPSKILAWQDVLTTLLASLWEDRALVGHYVVESITEGALRIYVDLGQEMLATSYDVMKHYAALIEDTALLALDGGSILRELPHGITRVTHMLAYRTAIAAAAVSFSIPTNWFQDVSARIANHFIWPEFSYTPPSLVFQEPTHVITPTATSIEGRATTLIQNITNAITYTGVSKDDLEQRLVAFRASLPTPVSFSGPPASTAMTTQAFSYSQKIDNLDGVTIRNATIIGGSLSGTSGLTPATTPGGSDSQLQFNNAGAFGGASGLVWNATSTQFGVGTSSPISLLTVYGDVALSGANRYLNFGDATSTAGYGIRDNSGSLEFKHLGGSWAALGSGGAFDSFTHPTSFGTTTSATTTPLFVRTGLFASSTSQFQNASSSQQTISSDLWLPFITTQALAVDAAGKLYGFATSTLSTISGALDLATQVGTSILAIANGGTGWATGFTANSILLGNGTSRVATTSAGTNGQVLALVGGVPNWVATTTLSTISGTLAIANGGTATTTFYNGGVTFYNSSLGTLSQASAQSGLFYDNMNSRLGIGTSTPLRKLDVSQGTSGGNVLADFYNTSATANSFSTVDISQTTAADSYSMLRFRNDADFWSIGIDGSDGDKFKISDSLSGTFSSTRLTLDQSGNLGIGTTTPRWLLNPTSATAPQIALSAGGGIAQWVFRNAGGNLYFATTTVAGTATTSATGLTILSSGNIGIGTTSPTSFLTIEGDSNLSSSAVEGVVRNWNTGTVATAQWTTQNSLNSEAAIGVSSSGYTPYGTTGADTAYLYGYAGGGLSIMADNGKIAFATGLDASQTEPVERMRITASGFVGIGTTTPLHNLTVASTTGSPFALSGGAGLAQWAFRNAGGNLYFATTTVAGTATTSISAFEIAGSGFGTTTIRGLSINGSATSTSNVGFNITSGCFAINDTCIGGGGGGTPGGSGTELQYRSGASTFGALTGSAFNSATTRIGFGTTTPSLGVLTLATTTEPQLSLSAGGGLAQWAFRNAGGNLYFATTTVAGTATTSTSALSIIGDTGNVGIGTTTPLAKLDVYGNLILSSSSPYINFGSTVGTGGYGFRDNAGTLQFKNSGSNWSDVTIATSGPSFLVTKSDQTVTSEVEGLVTWDTETFDTNNNFDLSTERFTPTVAGKYQINVQLKCPAADYCYSRLKKNGTTISEAAQILFDRGTEIYNVILVSMNGTTDYLEVYVITKSGAPTIPGAYTHFSGALIAPLNPSGGGWTNDGSASYLIDTTDKVGIGTTTPQWLLNPTSATAPQLSLSAGGGVAQWAFRNAGGNLYFATTTVAGTATTSTSALSIIGSTGNVGIGTTSPAAPFSVSNAVSGASPIALFVKGASAGIKLASDNILTGDTSDVIISPYGGTTNGIALRYLSSGGIETTGIALNSSGNVGIGTTTPTASLSVVGPTSFASQGAALYVIGTGNTTGWQIAQGGDTHLYLGYANGTVGSFNSGTGVYTASSDARFKNNVETIENSLDIVRQLRGVSFTWNEAHGGKDDFGFLAQELLPVLPEVVSQGMEGYYLADYTHIIPILASAIQELDLNLESIASSTASTTPASESFAEGFMNGIFARITAWLADAANGITTIVANVLNASEKICVDGECLTRDDIRALKDLAHPRDTNDPSDEEPPPPDPILDTDAPASEPAPDSTPDSPPDPTQEPEPEPEPEPEALLEPEPEPEPAPDPAPSPDMTSENPPSDEGGVE